MLMPGFLEILPNFSLSWVGDFLPAAHSGCPWAPQTGGRQFGPASSSSGQSGWRYPRIFYRVSQVMGM